MMTKHSIEDVDELKNSLKHELEREKRSGSIREKVYYGLFVFVLLYMSFIYFSTTRAFTLSHAMDRAYVYTKNNVVHINSYFKDIATKIIDPLSDRLLAMPSLFRLRIQQQMQPEIEKLAENIKTQFEANLKQVASMPSSTDNNLAQYQMVIAALRTQSMEAVDDFYMEKAPNLKTLVAELRRLQQGENLTDEEKTEQQLLGSWLSIMDHQGISWDMPKMVNGSYLASDTQAAPLH